MRIRTLAAAMAAAVVVSGCITMTPATYSVSPDVRQGLAKHAGAKVQVASMAGAEGFDPMCRAVGNLQFENGLTVPQFVQKAFNDELRYAGLHGDGVKLRGKLTRSEFSSSAALVQGYWDLALTLSADNGRAMDVAVRHDFESGFNGVTACNNTSQALAQATQALVRKAVTDPRFGDLLK